jgi:hypothetical protein
MSVKRWNGTSWVTQAGNATAAKYQATAPANPVAGDIWIKSDVDTPTVATSVFYRWRKTAAGDETTLSGLDDNGLSLSYTPNYEQLFINGVLQVRNVDYNPISSTSVTGLVALTAGDVVEIMSPNVYSVNNVYTQATSDAKYATLARTGQFLVVPTSVSVGAGTFTLSSNGAIALGSGVTSVTVNGAFSAAYENYEILWTGGTMTSSSADSQISFVFTGSTTGYNNILRYSNGSVMSVAAQSNAANWNWVGGGSTGSGLVQMKLYAPFLAVHTRMDSNAYNSWNNVNLGNSNGVHTVASSYTGFTINVTGTGTMVGGTIRIYGYNNGA